ncbi:MAG TPA: ATP-binding domain-containing protein [Oscillatoriaceae cyanobacterium M33_DOE_052]|uniref:DNA/RNA helicase n=1 Tax=Planktothricoides sp. SpSt-374 TaxID=2282167 RepID=A0A7C3VPM8_9CYAN|nr:ATP-binding domain-containing protein [Oscillatoriaceae cyanobacterium M33_DOE_052]
MTAENKLIVTEPIAETTDKSLGAVWEAVKTAFGQRDCIGYWRYPLFSQVGEVRKEPDILVVDKELGLIIIEIAPVPIEQIIAGEGDKWQLVNADTISPSPADRVQMQIQTLLGYCDRETAIAGKITGRALIALPHISPEQWQEKNLPNPNTIIFQNQLNSKIIEAIQNCQTIVNSDPLDEESWQILKAVISGTTILRKHDKNAISVNGKNRAAIIANLQEWLYDIDIQQEKIGKQIPPGPQRIRGIAGSGKTVLLCQKAAHMHLKHPEWDIALIFFTRTLYEQMEVLVDRWLRRFSNGDITYKKAQPKLKVMHAWGGKRKPGFYSTICQAHGIPPLTADQSQRRQPNESLADICNQLLQKQKINSIFDAILIDEGQDLVTDDELKYQENGEFKQTIYWLAYQSLRPIDPEHPEQRRLIWAYDEAQNLDSLKIPMAKELFGDSLTNLVTGQHKGGIKKSEIMHRCYRTPGPILTAAHAIGMGLLRPQGMLSGITTKQSWEAIGYQVTQGSFSPPGQQIILHRPPENSPNPIPQLWGQPVLEFHTYDSREDELAALAENINQNLSRDGLQPSQDILVLVLGSIPQAIELENTVATFLIDYGIDIYIATGKQLNQLNPTYPGNNPDRFWYRGGVTISRIHRAKGNEANLVYIIGLDNIAKNELDINLRNQVFVAMTRSGAWAYLSGIGKYPFYDEIRACIASGDTFTFTFKRPPKLSTNEPE